MFDLKNEAAGVVAIAGFVSLAFALAGVAGLVRVALGGGGNPLVLAITATLGLSGLAACRTAIESGYFEAGDETTEAPVEGEPPVSDVEPEGDVEAA